jgi:hypothetical protein
VYETRYTALRPNMRFPRDWRTRVNREDKATLDVMSDSVRMRTRMVALIE